jgi:pseudouridine kinase
VITGFFFFRSSLLHFWQAQAMESSATHAQACEVLCIGGINLDRKLKALQPLAAGSSNPCVAMESAGGVARNVAENLARLGLRTQLVGALGGDACAQMLLKQLHALNIDTHACATYPQGHTGSYTAILDTQGQMVMGMADMALTELLMPEVLQACGVSNACIAPNKLWMADMNLPAASLQWLASQALQAQTRLIILAVSEPKISRLPQDLRGVDTLVLNRGELAVLHNHGIWDDPSYGEITPNDVGTIFAHLQARGLQRLLVTCGDAGVIYAEAPLANPIQLQPELPAHMRVADVSGAGDALCAGLCASYLRYPEEPLAQHAKRAMKLAVLTVQTEQTVSLAITPDLI